jgi:hypothetical protein
MARTVSSDVSSVNAVNLLERCPAVFLALLLSTATAPSLNAQSSDDWAQVMRVPSGTRVQVGTTLNPSEKFRGELRSATPSDVTVVDESGAVRVYQRVDIARLRVRRSHVAPIAGAIAGAAWGGLAGAISDGGGAEKAAFVAVAVALVGGIGWLVGKAIQKGAWKTIYEAAP